MTSLGPTTEARFAAAFENTALATARLACSLLGIDGKTLREMTNEGVIRACQRGRRDAYSEAELRRFLCEPPIKEDIKWQSTNAKRRKSGTMTSPSPVVGFMEAQAKRDEAKRQSTKPKSGGN